MILGMGKLFYSDINPGEGGGMAAPAGSCHRTVSILSLCILHLLPPSTSGICPHHQLTTPTSHTHGAACRRTIPVSKQNPCATSDTRLHSKVQVHAVHWKKMPQKESIKNTVAFKCQQQKEREALQHGKILTKIHSLQVDSGFLLTSQKKRKSHSCLGCILVGQERKQKQTWKSREHLTFCAVTPRALFLLNETS